MVERVLCLEVVLWLSHKISQSGESLRGVNFLGRLDTHDACGAQR
jgi:hypothetical protein